jgi:hypothetical protein
MKRSSPAATGAAFSLTAGAGYAACALAFWIWPDAAAYLMNALLHGLDFRKLQSGPALFNFESFLYALATLMAWTFGLGALYRWVQGWIAGGRSPVPQ